ncbi:MAG TPA: DUF3857 and transglutaminase domain-containing protein [Clostridia bacterium]|nr:DUF3857 and transglutaminase domain-containing protein [Clostridia bacterium]
MRSLASVTLPSYDEKTDAVLLYSEQNVTVLSSEKVKTVVRQAYKILRPTGRDRGTVYVYLDSNTKLTRLSGWSIPAQGKDFEVSEKESIEVSPPMIEGSELISDLKVRILKIPAPDPGNIVGFEYEVEERPLVLQDIWHFQTEDPVRESHYSLQLPPGWESSASWLNYPEAKPTQSGANLARWSISDLKGTRSEEAMPPMKGLLGKMIVSYYPSGGSSVNGFSNWQQMGNWYRHLTAGRFDASAEIKQKVASLTGPSPKPLEGMAALASFVQQNIRYVAIELGIGGWQPHPAAYVFTHRYGDCKDKATLMMSMLREMGVESYYVVINTRRGSITSKTPAHRGFNHAIIAIKLPEGISDPSLLAVTKHPRLGNLLFFDPTNEFTPFGHIGGYLQSNIGLLVTPDGGELIELPKQPSSTNGVQRVAKLVLDASGTLHGNVREIRIGDRAAAQRNALRSVSSDSDKIKPVEILLASSLSTFHLTKASVINAQIYNQPFAFDYTFEAANYAKRAGNLLLVRPRVLGSKASTILEIKEPRRFPIEFDGPMYDTDNFEVALPAGYEVDELPPPVDAEFSFASYHSKTEVKDNAILYTRTFELKELSVPVAKAEELKKFYRIIANDERSTAVLKQK